MQSVILAAGIALLSGTVSYDVYFNKADVQKTDSSKIMLNQDK